MADLPTAGQFVTGGLVGAVIAAAAWLINQFRSAVADGEEIAARRIAALTDDIDSWRERTLAQQETHLADIVALRAELGDYRRDLAEARSQLRECDRKSHEQRRQIAGLKIDLDGLRKELADLRGGSTA